LAAGNRRLHIVAPPGSGKTIMGLYLWACCVRQPALVLSPNSAIQAQWAARTSLFADRHGQGVAEWVSTLPRDPRLLTSLTYQSITLPARAGVDVNARAIDLWIQTLLEDDQAESSSAAETWISELCDHNPDYYRRRLAYYGKRIRDDDACGGQAIRHLHDSCIQTLNDLRGAGIGLLILDECHHLMGHWGRVLSEVSEYLGDPIVVGLTATPPDREGRQTEDVERYDRFFGPVDFEVPVPAVVKDGYLAPYQDLAYFVRPSERELEFIARVDDQFDHLVEDLCQIQQDSDRGGDHRHSDGPTDSRQSLTDWLSRVLEELSLPGRRVSSWHQFYALDPSFADAAVWFLRSRGLSVAADAAVLPGQSDDPYASLATLVDRFTRHHLRRSRDPRDHRLAEMAVNRLRMLGVQITETGHRTCASPVSRVIAYTQNKAAALVPILRQEIGSLGSQLRAVVIADYEKTSAIAAEISHLFDGEAGGAVAAFRSLLSDPQTNALDPILVTGSTVLVDADLVVQFLSQAKMWLRRKSKNVTLVEQTRGTFCVIHGSGSDWCPRVYVELITELFQRGTTRCLVGTRGLLGEGWDANRINVLIDLSTSTTSMSVNQLRGRSIRLDPHNAEKVANNWDVVCIAPEFSRGLDDYQRFKKKHQSIFGVCDDGAIEQGVGHVHAALTDLRPELLDGDVSEFNQEMLLRSGRRHLAHQQWAIGSPYSSEPIHAVEVRAVNGFGDPMGYPPLPRGYQRWSPESLVDAIGQAILAGLEDTGCISAGTTLRVAPRDGGYLRAFLQGASKEDSASFAAAMAEAVGPLQRPRYVIPRFIDDLGDTFLGRLLPEMVRRLFQRGERRIAMWHTVPSALAAKRDVVDVFEEHWGKLVSPGKAVFAKYEKGQQMIDQAVAAGQVPDTIIHNKEIFL
jgi:hypothetical protein